MGFVTKKIPNPKCTSKKANKSATKIPQLPLEQTLEKSSDPQMCDAYVEDIYEYIHNMEMEAKRRPVAGYIEKVQKNVDARMRSIIINALIWYAEEQELLSETIHRTISYIDRFLSTNVVNINELFLCGFTSLLIATKYEEICPQDVETLCCIKEFMFTKQEIVKMEADMLKYLNYEIGCPTAHSFIRRLTDVAQEDYETPNLQLEFLCYYLAELSLLEYDCVKFLPSMVAASATFLARFTLEPKSHPWDLSLQQVSGYKPSDLKECVQILHDLQLGRLESQYMAVTDKYKQQKFNCVSELSSPSVIPVYFFDDL